MTRLLWLFLLFFGVALPQAQAQDALQKKAEDVLRSEPLAKQVTVREEVSPQNTEGKDIVDFMSFDLDGDGVLSQDEVGEKLFTIFDRDGNHVIDNIEMRRPSLVAFTPMRKKTIEIIDYGSDTGPQKRVVSEEDFLEKTQLGKFDPDGDGLSPLDFLGVPFNQINVRRDAVIDLYEFKRAYAAVVKPKHEEDFNYNE